RARRSFVRGQRGPRQAGLPPGPRRPSAAGGVTSMTFTVASFAERQIAKAIDHSLLRPELDDAFVEEGCHLAAEYDVASVCVRPGDVRRGGSVLVRTRARD